MCVSALCFFLLRFLAEKKPNTQYNDSTPEVTEKKM